MRALVVVLAVALAVALVVALARAVALAFLSVIPEGICCWVSHQDCPSATP